MIVSVVFFALELVVPVGATSSTVSGESVLKVSSSQMKKTLLQRKIRILKTELAKITTAIGSAEKKIQDLKAKKRDVTTLENRLASLKTKKEVQESNLAKLITEFSKLK